MNLKKDLPVWAVLFLLAFFQKRGRQAGSFLMAKWQAVSI